MHLDPFSPTQMFKYHLIPLASTQKFNVILPKCFTVTVSRLNLKHRLLSFSNKGTEFVDKIEVLKVGEAETGVVAGGEETPSVKHVEETGVLDKAGAEEARNAEAEAVLLEKAKRDFLFYFK